MMEKRITAAKPDAIHLAAMFPHAQRGEEFNPKEALRVCLCRAAATLELLASAELGATDDAVDAVLGYVHMAQSLHDWVALSETEGRIDGR